MSRVALLLCLAAVSEGAKKAGFQKIPQFYTSSDCSGPIDSESKMWSMKAKDNVAVMPFKTEGDYMQSWVFNKCLAGSTYSVKVTIDATACAANNTADQLVLNYYAGSTTCGGSAAATPMTADTCVPYSRGSVKLVTEIPLDDMCAFTDLAVKMSTGGLKLEVWVNPSCSGSPAISQDVKGSFDKECGAQPDCEGCCEKYESCKAQGTYEFNLQACKRSGNSWRHGIKFRSYSNEGCTKEIDTPLSKGAVEPTDCVVVKANGNTGSLRTSFVAPMTIDVQCKAIEAGLRNNIDPSVVSWDQMNSGVAAVPHLLALFALIATILL